MSIHVHFYREQSAVTLIQRVQHSKNRLGVETIAALLQMHHSWNALPDRNRVQCERSDPLTWVQNENTHCKRSMCETGVMLSSCCIVQLHLSFNLQSEDQTFTFRISW